jgi:hypothetical protein
MKLNDRTVTETRPGLSVGHLKTQIRSRSKFNRLGQTTKYNRAPPTWRSQRGYELVAGILKIQARNKCGVAAAVRQLKKSEPKEWPEKERDLQRRYRRSRITGGRGSGRTVALQPLSLQGSLAFNVVLGVSSLKLRPATWR